VDFVFLSLRVQEFIETDAKLLFQSGCPFSQLLDPSRLFRPFSTYRMDAARFCSRLGLLPHVPPNVDAEQLWLQLLPKDRRLAGAHALGHAHFFSAICDWLVWSEPIWVTLSE
jgi:hypothetical protein